MFRMSDDMADSFCLIPSKSDAVAKALQEENIALKAELETLQKRLASAEGMLKMRQEQDQQLRDSILLARKEVRHTAACPDILLPMFLGASCHGVVKRGPAADAGASRPRVPEYQRTAHPSGRRCAQSRKPWARSRGATRTQGT